MEEKIFTTKSPAKTKLMARIFAQALKKNKNKQKSALVIGLFGNLGSGKTSFTQGLAKAFGIKEKVQSPTFVIFKRYDFHKHKIKVGSFRNLYHFDCYRIENQKEIADLGFKELIKNPHNIIIIEWANKIKKILPRKMIKINFKILNGDNRKITFSA